MTRFKKLIKGKKMSEKGAMEKVQSEGRLKSSLQGLASTKLDFYV